jgi:hypothetical protein
LDGKDNVLTMGVWYLSVDIFVGLMMMRHFFIKNIFEMFQSLTFMRSNHFSYGKDQTMQKFMKYKNSEIKTGDIWETNISDSNLIGDSSFTILFFFVLLLFNTLSFIFKNGFN